MTEKVLSFLLTLSLIAWNIFDITRGNHPVISWILLGVFSIGGLFELCAIFEEKNKGRKPVEEAASDN